MANVKQLILFGSPGVGKSYHIRSTLLPELHVDPDGPDCVSCVFHPEYSYGDFLGKLLPITKGGKVEYDFYEGHFLIALARAYRNILTAQRTEGATPAHVVLVIDELNRGNSSSIFGTAFQLLDRSPDGWSAYSVQLSRMEFERMLTLMQITQAADAHGNVVSYKEGSATHANLDFIAATRANVNRNIRLPPNLHLIATVNTSDASIYYMDSAFKRRWEWMYFDADSQIIASDDVQFASRAEWEAFVVRLNRFIRDHGSFVRNMEDKQVGKYFIASEPIKRQQIQCKLLFFLWDSVFARDRKPLEDLLGLERHSLQTFGDLARRDSDFVRKILAYRT